MHIPITKNIELVVYISKLEEREGVCSRSFKNKDEHILLWDFDSLSLRKTIKALKLVQLKYELPSIYVVSSSPLKYHAYSFTARPFLKIVHILSGTPDLDENYLRLGMARGYYTLRISPRKHDSFKLVRILDSQYPNEINPLDVTVNKYFTANKGGK